METTHTFIDFVTAWNLSSPFLPLLALSTAAYSVGLARLKSRAGGKSIDRWRVSMGYGAFLLMALALFGPFDTYADYLFLVHMLQHLTLALAAAPLLLMAGVMPAFMWSMPRFLRQGVGAEFAVTGMARRVVTFGTRPHVALVLFVGALWFWHIPDFYDAAVRNELIHLVEHLSFFLGALLFWWPIIGPAPVRSALSYPQRLLYLLLVVTPSAVLAALVTLAGSSIYESYDGSNEVWGLDPLSDQRIGGLIMWVPGNFVYLITMTALFFKWYESEELKTRSQRPRRRRRRRRPESTDDDRSA